MKKQSISSGPLRKQSKLAWQDFPLTVELRRKLEFSIELDGDNQEGALTAYLNTMKGEGVPRNRLGKRGCIADVLKLAQKMCARDRRRWITRDDYAAAYRRAVRRKRR